MKNGCKTAVFSYFVAVALFFFSSGFAAQPNPSGRDVTAFKDVRVFDGKQIIDRAKVVIRGEKITDVGKNIPIPEGAEIISGDDLTLLPGLIDSHVHIFSWNDLRLEAVFGVTTVMDMMTTKAFLQQTKAMLKTEGKYKMADFYSSGQPATCPGGHGTEWGTEIPTLTSPDQAAAFISYSIESGSDYIKIMSGVMKKTLSPEVVAALAAEAKKRNMLTVAHIETKGKALEAVKAGVNGLGHCFADQLPDDEFIKIMKEKNAFIIPTLSVMNALEDASVVDIPADTRFSAYLTPEVIKALSTERKKQKNFSYKVAEKTAYMLHKAGIRILAGSDSYNPGTIAGASLHGELELLVKAGLSPLDALAAATSLPADTFGLKDRGRISAGMRADLLLVKGNPAADITSTRNIIGVWIEGERLDRETYRAEIEQENKEWKESCEIPPPMNSASGVICDFDESNYSPNFGFFFFEMSDKLMGGSSSAMIELVAGGAEDTVGSLKITGNIDEKSPFPWAGAAFFPSAMETSTANLSKWNTLSFWAEGETSMMVMFLLSDRQMPVFKVIPVTDEWKKFEIGFTELGSENGKNITAMIFGSNHPGGFSIKIDQIMLLRK